MRRFGLSLRTLLVSSLLLLVTFPAATLRAEMFVFPRWDRISCGGDTYACYTFEKTKKILKVDLDMQLTLRKLELCEGSLQEYRGFYYDLLRTHRILIDVKNKYDAHIDEKNKLIQEFSAKAAQAESRDILGGALPWVVTTLVVFSALSLAGGYYLGSKK